jgi:hypothetical protein
MTDLHLAVGLLAVAANVAAAAWGVVVVARRRPSFAFLRMARTAQAVTAAQLALGLLVLTGANADDNVPSGGHMLAAGGVIVALAAAEALGRIPGRRATANVGVGHPALAHDAPPGLGQTAVLTAGFVAVTGAAVLAVTTGLQ